MDSNIAPSLKIILTDDFFKSEYNEDTNVNDILDNIRSMLGDNSFSEVNPDVISDFAMLMGSNAPYPLPYFPPPTGSKNAENVAQHYMCYFGNLWLSHLKYYPDKVEQVLANNRVIDADPEEKDRIKFEVSCELNDTMWMLAYYNS